MLWKVREVQGAVMLSIMRCAVQPSVVHLFFCAVSEASAVTGSVAEIYNDGPAFVIKV